MNSKSLFWLPGLVAALLLLPVAVPAQFLFTTNNGAITITQYTGSGGDVVIPDTINGLKVAVVGSAAFYQISAAPTSPPSQIMRSSSVPILPV